MEFVKPKLIVISAPSGSGKTSIFKGAQQILPKLIFSISYTTRKPRHGEIDGRDYFFINVDQFRRMIDEGQFLEWAEVYGNYYGTSRSFIEQSQQEGKIVVLDIDVQGAMQLRDHPELNAVYVFIMPPTLEELANRLIGRGTEDHNSLKKRLENARKEIAYCKHYDYQIINDQLNQAVEDFLKVILSECYEISEAPGADIDTLIKELYKTVG